MLIRTGLQEHIYQEQCEARKEQGYQTIFNAAVFVVVSTGMIILSVGLATPAVVWIGSIGLSAGMVVECGVVAFFVSDTAEGIGDIYYGSIGDLESIAVNPLKQVLAGGDDEFYAMEKDFFMMVVGCGLGVNASINAGASFGKAMSIELAQCAIGGIASEAVIQYAEANNWSEAERNLGVLFASTIASTLTGMGMQQIGQPRSGSSLTLGEHASIVDNIADDVVVPRVGSPELDVPESMITPIQSIDAGDVSIGRAPDIPENVATPMQGVGYVSEGGSKTSWYKADGTMNYPPNNGAVPGTEVNISLKPGDTLGRYGNIGDKSNFVTQTGANADKLALPPTTDPSIYQEFKVIKEIPNTIQAEIAAWGNSAGGGLQYELPMPILQLIREGYIVPK